MGNAAALVGGIDPAAGKLPRARHACKRTRFVEPRDGEPCVEVGGERFGDQRIERRVAELTPPGGLGRRAANAHRLRGIGARRSEEHTSELQSLMRTSYDVFRLTKNTPAACRQSRE